MFPRILYEDNHVLVAVKPHMLPSQSDISGDPDMLSLLNQYIKEKYQKPGNVYLGLVHRLDRPTGGVMVFARTSKAAARLSAQVRSGQMEKRYLAVTQHCPDPAGGILRDFLLKNSSTNTVSVVSSKTPGAKEALLSYRVIERQKPFFLSEISLKTGRSHQIRVQFSSRGWPLYGDARYGKGEGDHLCLYAYSLTFIHPVKKERLSCSDLPSSYAFSLFTFQSLRKEIQNPASE